ncbi:sporulenol synthase [Anaeramoeba flamelloides]|uniref:Sporulenol synthase n=1 Tax=Anaeramoeba flamelloides TaxID=1746091 RepID=A0AAV7ZQJ1_9EUKA|nr:sporulenol synthase [Anaeramoeba flamelloides]KAJ6226858.1 sporulenol synthase [Anaeramoeba flamelloides]|eukprot:Anaeramoba_flamelloidesa89715_654.p1 GENE.a89715_654~~a89715_654.p1  ORF type:complete len:665 (-),score=134.01 a89715_654:162-2156(-)
MKFQVLIAFLITLCLLNQLHGQKLGESLDLDRIHAVIKQAGENIREVQLDDFSWNFPPFLGTNFISQHYIVNHYLDRHEETLLDVEKLKRILLKDQLPDGSWKQVPDLNKYSGEIDTTIYNYWALKVMGFSVDSPQLKKAREFVISKGGIENSMTMTKIWITLFGGYKWSKLPWVPLFAFNQPFIELDKQLGQWVAPHLFGIVPCLDMKPTKYFGESFRLDELYLDAAKYVPKLSSLEIFKGYNEPLRKPSENLHVVMEKIMSIQGERKGLFGGYTVSSMFCSIALLEYNNRYDHRFYTETFNEQVVIDSTTRALNTVDTIYYDPEASIKTTIYKGILDDGRYWDTILSAESLIAAEMSTVDEIQKTVDYLIDHRSHDGSMSYGYDFEAYPDFDDTAEFVDLMVSVNKDGKYDEPISQAINWLLSMQNKEGGWAAFDKDLNGNKMVKLITRKFANSAELFDPSCADITGHVLRAFGHTKKFTLEDQPIKDAIKFLEDTQEEFGGWEGRWGINYIYGTSAALYGLSSMEFDIVHHDWTLKALKWLESLQNSDGGFGETGKSYKDPIKYAGRGYSTPTQTAWALFPFIEARKQGFKEFDHIIEKGIKYLIEDFHSSPYPNKWKDRSCVGTGHRTVPLFMEYPVYAYSFPLWALSNYVDLINNLDKY